VNAALVLESAASSDRERDVPRAFVARRSSVRTVARGEDNKGSSVDVTALTSGASVAEAVVGSRIARRQMSRSGNRDEAGRATARVDIVCETAATTTGLGGVFDFST